MSPSSRPCHRLARWLCSVLAAALAVAGPSGCGGAVDAPSDVLGIALLSPFWLTGQVMHLDDQQRFERLVAEQRPDPGRIPAAVASRIEALPEIHAETLDGLIEVTGLTPYRKDLFIFSTGTQDQEVWLYYRHDAALNCHHDAITRRIVGPIVRCRRAP